MNQLNSIDEKIKLSRWFVFIDHIELMEEYKTKLIPIMVFRADSWTG